MFPIVPYHLNPHVTKSISVTVSDITGSNKLLASGRITASCKLDPGVTSAPIKVNCVGGDTDIVQMCVTKNTCGNIDLDESSKRMWKSEIHWLRTIRLSDDCHSFNTLLKLINGENGRKALILQIVKPINVGEELLLWFSEEVLACLQIVFLSPTNIQGQKKYVCTNCSALYESPNPLKVHLTLTCSRKKISAMWENLILSTTKSSNHISKTHLVETEFTFELSRDPSPKENDRIALDLSRTPIPSTHRDTSISPSTMGFFKPYAYHNDPPIQSAFTPVQRQSINNNLNTSPSPQQTLSPNLVSYPINYPILNLSPDGFGSITDSMTTHNMDNEAHIETLVSSLGKSKQGHICLYCGKCYSRKYGLKIHIRTHTGYKPLKCKYCLRPFGDPSNLNKHVRLHAEGDTPYRCDLCGKVLVRRRDLDRHLKSRHMIDMHPTSIGEDVEDTESEEDLAIAV